MAVVSTASEWKIAEENAGEKVENQGSRLEVYSCKKKKSIQDNGEKSRKNTLAHTCQCE